MSARTLDYRGTVVPDQWAWRQLRDRLGALAEQYPVGLRVTHACGRQGTVALDQPDHVPGLFLGGPVTVCLTGEWHEQPMVFAHWDNDSEITWGVWVPADLVRRGGAPAVNRPGNKARIGGRR
ncbi:hypothetical protein [Streptomyces canus]|uniref:hypothetical protein n=1 Tax=Streptomyces canus TaxID=58343 RepID=UPI003CEE3B24